jgi:hypothetical protein
MNFQTKNPATEDTEITEENLGDGLSLCPLCSLWLKRFSQ